MVNIFIETARLILRDWQEDDIEPFVALNSDVEVMQYFPNTSSREHTLAQIESIKHHIAQYGYGFFALERKDNREFIGFTGITHPRFESWFTPCEEIGWRLSKSNWGSGFATEAARACIDHGFRDFNLDKIYSFTAVDNKPSENVMKKLNMEFKGEFDHPNLEDCNWLKRHVLYCVDNPKQPKQ